MKRSFNLTRFSIEFHSIHYTVSILNHFSYESITQPFYRRIYLLLAHLSRMLICELIVAHGPASVVARRPSVRRPQCSNIFFSETAWPIKAKFNVKPHWVGGTKFCSRHVGHMTKMAAAPIYHGKTPSKIFFSRTGTPIFTKLGM